jgi:hypothetical protein
MFIIVSRFFIRYCTPKGVAGFTFLPFIVVEERQLKNDRVFINHEKIHLFQQAELLLVFFLVFYAVEFLIRLLQYGNPSKAYRNISFEREAYGNERNLHYLKTRKPYSFIKYLANGHNTAKNE